MEDLDDMDGGPRVCPRVEAVLSLRDRLCSVQPLTIVDAILATGMEVVVEQRSMEGQQSLMAMQRHDRVHLCLAVQLVKIEG